MLSSDSPCKRKDLLPSSFSSLTIAHRGQPGQACAQLGHFDGRPGRPPGPRTAILSLVLSRPWSSSRHVQRCLLQALRSRTYLVCWARSSCGSREDRLCPTVSLQARSVFHRHLGRSAPTRGTSGGNDALVRSQLERSALPRGSGDQRAGHRPRPACHRLAVSPALACLQLQLTLRYTQTIHASLESMKTF